MIQTDRIWAVYLFTEHSIVCSTSALIEVFTSLHLNTISPFSLPSFHNLHILLPPRQLSVQPHVLLHENKARDPVGLETPSLVIQR
jgi:hypothetical protein